jgi:hypothetical protein
MTAGYTREEIRAQLVKLAAYIPPGETLELCVFGGSTVLCWGMQDRLSNDVDVLQSMSSAGLLEVAAAAAGAIRFRNVEDLDCEILAMKVMPDNVHLFLN